MNFVMDFRDTLWSARIVGYIDGPLHESY